MDGFRFDLGSIMTRTHSLWHPPFLCSTPPPLQMRWRRRVMLCAWFGCLIARMRMRMPAEIPCRRRALADRHRHVRAIHLHSAAVHYEQHNLVA